MIQQWNYCVNLTIRELNIWNTENTCLCVRENIIQMKILGTNSPNQTHTRHKKNLNTGLWCYNFYILRSITLVFSYWKNPCSANGTNGCVENPWVYTVQMEGVVAIGQQPAHITNLETLQANSTIDEAATLSSLCWCCCCFLVHKAREVFEVTNVVFTQHSFHSTHVLSLCSTFFFISIVPSEDSPHDAYMDNHQNRYAHKQYDQRNHNFHHWSCAIFTHSVPNLCFPSNLEGYDSDKICLLLRDNKLKLVSNNHRL